MIEHCTCPSLICEIHGYSLDKLRNNAPKTCQKSPTIVPERLVLPAVLQTLRSHPSVAWADRMSVGAARLTGGFYVRFNTPGTPDIIGQMKDGRFLAVECKSTNGKVTPDQHTFLARVTKWGGVAGVARSVEDALKLVSNA